MNFLSYTTTITNSTTLASKVARTLTTRGTIEGLIGYEQKGENGFGYDPIVYVPEYDATTAELSMEVKNSISHRGKALTAMKAKLLEMGLVKKK